MAYLYERGASRSAGIAMAEPGDIAGQIGEGIVALLDTVLWRGITVGDLLLSLIILLAGLFVVRYLLTAERAVLRRMEVPEIVQRFLVRLSRVLLYVLVVGLMLAPLGIDLTSLALSFGVAGIIVGLALQGVLGNLAAGIVLVVMKPFRIGHLVEVAGITGFVEDLSVNATTLKTFDGKKVMIPSQQVWNAPITNYHSWPIRRVDLVVSVSYEDDVPRALRVVQGVLDADGRVLKEPAALVNVREFAASSVDLNIFAWAKQEDWGTVRTDTLLRVKEAFAREGITIPYPTRRIVSEGEE